MATERNLRKVSRTSLEFPQIAVISFETQGRQHSYFVKVTNLSIQGALIESEIALETDFEIHFTTKNIEINQWDSFYCRIAWSQAAAVGNSIHLGLEYLFPVENDQDTPTDDPMTIIHDDVDFLLNLNLFKTLPREGLNPFLNALVKKKIKKGEDLFSYDRNQNSLFIIQKGFCSIQADNEKKPTAFRSEGEIIGDVAFLTKGRHKARVKAESPMVVWQLSKNKFNSVCKDHPDVSGFLTHLFISQIDNPDNQALRSIGAYQISQVSHEDTFSRFFKARHHLFDICTSIKMLKHIYAADTDIVNEMIRRSKIIRKMDHPNIARLISAEKCFGTLFTTSENMIGETLGKMLERAGRVPFFNALKIMYQIASALACAHDRKLYFHLIHPDNFIISGDCRVKLINLEIPYKDVLIDDKTNYFIYYLPPEKFKTGRLAHFDIYGFGRLAFEMITGVHYNPLKQNAGQIQNGLNNAFNLDAVPYPELIKAIKNIIFKACRESEKKRYASMAELKQDLANILAAYLPDYVAPPTDEKLTTYLRLYNTNGQIRELHELLENFHNQAAQKGIDLKMN